MTAYAVPLFCPSCKAEDTLTFYSLGGIGERKLYECTSCNRIHGWLAVERYTKGRILSAAYDALPKNPGKASPYRYRVAVPLKVSLAPTDGPEVPDHSVLALEFSKQVVYSRLAPHGITDRYEWQVIRDTLDYEIREPD